MRTPADTNPAWQCPRCQIAYTKFIAATAGPIHERIAEHGRAIAERASSNLSLYSLVAVNALTLVIALALHMSIRDLMLVYWIQSVIIGLENVIRILTLNQFSTEGFTMGGEEMPETFASQLKIAGFFAFHYGFFHLVYFLFIVSPEGGKNLGLASPLAYVLCGLGFLLQHTFSLIHNLKSDAAGRPNLGTLMKMPYLRIVPMHLTIMFGLGFFGGGVPSLILFVALKTVADSVMHSVQHHLHSGLFSLILGDPPDEP